MKRFLDSYGIPVPVAIIVAIILFCLTILALRFNKQTKREQEQIRQNMTERRRSRLDKKRK